MLPLTAGRFGVIAYPSFQFGSVWCNVGMAVTSSMVALDVGSIPTTITKTNKLIIKWQN